MSSLSITTRKSLMLFSGRAYPELADEVGKYLDVSVTPQSAYDFANGEIFVRFEESVRGSDAFLIQSCGVPINTWVMETLIMIDALKRASAKRITVVLPFYPYARQDKKHRGREPISARLIADLLKTAGAQRLMTVDLHTDQIQGFFDGRSTTCSPSRCSPATSVSGTSTTTSRSSPRIPAGSAPPNAGPTGSAAHRSPSSTRPGTPPGPTRWSPTGSSVTSTAAPASLSTT